MSGEAQKIGSEFLVNTETASIQSVPTITGLSNGGFVVSWFDDSRTNGDTDLGSIRAQVFDVTGAKVGSEFLVNTQTSNSQTLPTITGLSNGGFVVGWQDSSLTLGDASGTSIKAQIFTSGGAKVGSEFLVNTQTANVQDLPTITGLTNGGFVVSWQDLSGTLGDPFGSIKAQVFTAAGNKVGSEFLVNTETASFQDSPTTAGLSNGGFVVSWRDFSGTLGDADSTSIKAQVFDASGNKVGSEFLVNTETADSQYKPAITGLSNGGFVVSWFDFSHTLGDAQGTSIKAQVFDASGNKVGSEFLVNTETAGSQDRPTITGLSNGGFVISWDDDSGTLGDADGSSVKAQVFDASGNKVGSEFLVNTETSNSQQLPTITSLSNGGFAVSWVDGSQTLGDAEGTSIKAQVFGVAGVTAPPAPTLVLPDIDTAAGSAPQLAGQAQAGETVTIRDGGAIIGTALADGTGRFDFTVPQLGTGEHSLTAAIETAGLPSPASAALVFEVGTAATIAAALDIYAAKAGLAAIIITDAHVLPFTSKADMDHVLQADGAALSKIAGGYSFAVTTTTPEATTVSSYDSGGHITKSVTTEADGDRITDQFDAAGTLTYKDVFHADTGNHDGHYYAISGKPYATQDAVYDSAFNLLSVERHYANGVTAFTLVNNPDGTTEVHGYDTSGRETSRVVGIVSGERDAFQFTYANASTTPTSSFQTHYGPAGAKQWTDQTNPNGSHIQTSLAAGTTLVSHAGVADSFVGFRNGADSFVFDDGFGKDRIWGFAAGGGTGHDVMRLDTDLAADFAAVQSLMRQVGNDTLITFDASDSILVKGVAPTALTADNFQFVHQDALLV